MSYGYGYDLRRPSAGAGCLAATFVLMVWATVSCLSIAIPVAIVVYTLRYMGVLE